MLRKFSKTIRFFKFTEKHTQPQIARDVVHAN